MGKVLFAKCACLWTRYCVLGMVAGGLGGKKMWWKKMLWWEIQMEVVVVWRKKEEEGGKRDGLGIQIERRGPAR